MRVYLGKKMMNLNIKVSILRLAIHQLLDFELGLVEIFLALLNELVALGKKGHLLIKIRNAFLHFFHYAPYFGQAFFQRKFLLFCMFR